MMDVLIDNTISKLENATIYDNSDTSNVKFEPKVPSGIDMSRPQTNVEKVCTIKRRLINCSFRIASVSMSTLTETIVLVS